MSTTSPDHWSRVKELFAELSELPRAERDARLLALAGEPAVRDEVAALLAASDSVGDRFEHAPALDDADFAPVPSLVGQRVGPYLVSREVGQGGMGAVYEAHRVDDAYRKRVAIKTVAAGRDSLQIYRRFRQERQILARLEHRNIAALLDGGVTDDGRPYFAMEYVEGEPIDAWCRSRQLGVRERLQLFRQVCGAVQYAHQHLVVHRDLKPGNILVGTDGTVKLLDFGISKLLEPGAMDDSALTHTGLLPMTAAYASPEQLAGEPVTTASDLYSLGIVLYELLAGRPPFASGDEPLLAARRRSLDTPLVPPSRTATAATALERGEGSARRLQRTLSGELDNIVLMALRREPTRRYRSVEQLAEDLRRYLEGQPVLAQPDTLGYRAGKFVRRNRVAVAASAVAAAALVAGTIVSVRQARVARQERDRALLETKRTAQVTQFIQDVLSSAKPQEHGREISVVQAIDAAIPRIDSSFANQPDLRAALKNTLGSTLHDMFLDDRARPLVEDALRIRTALDAGAPSRERAEILYDLAGIEEATGTLARAESLYVAALTMYGQLPVVDSVEIYHGMTNYAGAIMGQGRLAEAVEIYGRVARRLAVLAPHDSVASAVRESNYATALAQLGRYDEAVPHFRLAVALLEATRGPDDFRVGAVLQPLAGALLFQGKEAEAEQAARRSWEIVRHALGPDNASTLSSQRMLLTVLAESGRCAEALPQARSILALRGTSLPEQDVSVGAALVYEGWCEAQMGDPVRGVAHVREGLAQRRATMPAAHWAIAHARSYLGDALARRGPAFAVEAEQELRAGYEGLARELDPRHVRVAAARVRLAQFLRAQDRGAEAEALERTAAAPVSGPRS